MILTGNAADFCFHSTTEANLCVDFRPEPASFLPVLSDRRAGVGQAQEDLHVALLFRVAPDACDEALNSAVLRLIQRFPG